jgi:hypothetical protein
MKLCGDRDGEDGKGEMDAEGDKPDPEPCGSDIVTVKK